MEQTAKKGGDERPRMPRMMKMTVVALVAAWWGVNTGSCQAQFIPWLYQNIFGVGNYGGGYGPYSTGYRYGGYYGGPYSYGSPYSAGYSPYGGYYGGPAFSGCSTGTCGSGTCGTGTCGYSGYGYAGYGGLNCGCGDVCSGVCGTCVGGCGTVGGEVCGGTIVPSTINPRTPIPESQQKGSTPRTIPNREGGERGTGEGQFKGRPKIFNEDPDLEEGSGAYKNPTPTRGGNRGRGKLGTGDDDVEAPVERDPSIRENSLRKERDSNSTIPEGEKAPDGDETKQLELENDGEGTAPHIELDQNVAETAPPQRSRLLVESRHGRVVRQRAMTVSGRGTKKSTEPSKWLPAANAELIVRSK